MEPRVCRSNVLFSTLKNNFGCLPQVSNSTPWNVQVKCLMKHVKGYNDTLGRFGTGKLREDVFLWLKILKFEAKIEYLNKCKYENKVPLRFLSHLVKLENCFKKNFLKYCRFFSRLGYKIIRMDLKQAYWFLRIHRNQFNSFMINANNSFLSVIHILKEICG